jgi:hypothetical protein
MPRTSSKDLASISALELSHALQHPAPAAPFSHIGTAQLQALRQLSDIFSTALPTRPASQMTTPSLRPTTIGSTTRQQPTIQTPFTPQPVHNPVSSPSTSPRRSQRSNPCQVPSPKVTPRLNYSYVAPPRVLTPLPPPPVIPITLHPAAGNAPYIYLVSTCLTRLKRSIIAQQSHGTTHAPVSANQLLIWSRRVALGSSVLLRLLIAYQCPITWLIQS